MVVNFIKVIEDASSYLFSLNHSLPYSYIGYACGFLRYYYTLEFTTCALNNVMYKSTDNADTKTDKIIKYAMDKGIRFYDFRFGFSKAEYSCDKKTNSIYKGLKSIKYMNEQMAEELFELAKNKYDNFVDLLVDITEKTSVNSRQMKILIKLDFFDMFGKNKYLLDTYEYFTKKYKKTLNQETKLKRIDMIKNEISSYKNEDLSVTEILETQSEFLGYLT